MVEYTSLCIFDGSEMTSEDIEKYKEEIESKQKKDDYIRKARYRYKETVERINVIAIKLLNPSYSITYLYRSSTRLMRKRWKAMPKLSFCMAASLKTYVHQGIIADFLM